MRALLRRFHRIFPHLRRQRRRLVIGLLCLPLHAGVILMLPWWMGWILDGLIGSEQVPALDAGGLAQASLFLAGLAVLESVLRYVSRRSLIDASREAEAGLKAELVAHVTGLEIAWFDHARTGDLVSRLTQDVELVRFLFGPVLLHGGSALLVVPGGFVAMTMLSPPVTLTCGAAFAVMFFGLRWFMPRIHRHSKAVQEAIGDLSQRVQEDITGIRTLMSSGATVIEEAALARLNRRYLVHNLRLVRLRAWVNVLLHSVSRLVILGVLLVGGHQVMAGDLTVGEVFQFLGYLGLMMWPLQALGWSLGTIPRALAAADRLEEVFTQPRQTTTGEHPVLAGSLEVRGLSFAYPGHDHPALHDVSFSLAPGQKLGIVGPVSSGKSTLLSLLLRFYDPPPGTIFLDGHDILSLDPALLRACFALAPQDPFLFSDTLGANIAFGRGGEVEDEVLEPALYVSALDQDMERFAEGLDTVLGERGVTLSGGQKQRVSLARAMAVDRPTLILDDTLSAVDTPTERRILERLDRARGRRSMLVVTHRLSAVRNADLILVLEDGHIAESGNHDDLVATGGFYATAWRRQMEAEALEGQEGGST